MEKYKSDIYILFCNHKAKTISFSLTQIFEGKYSYHLLTMCHDVMESGCHGIILALALLTSMWVWVYFFIFL